MKFAIPFTAFYRATALLPVTVQERACKDWAAANGFTITHEYDASKMEGARDELIGGLRDHDGVIIAALWLFAEPGKGSFRPVVDQTKALAQIEKRSRIVVEALTGVTSMDREMWPERKAEAIEYIAAGKRRIKPRKPVTLKKPSKRAASGTLARWLDPANKALWDKWHAHYTSRKFATTEDAYNALPAKIRDEIGSLRMMAKIFGPRLMGDKRAGGRPRKLNQ